MKKEGTGVAKNLRYFFLLGIIATGLMTIIATGGGGGGGGDVPNITVTDPVLPDNDLQVPFGEAKVGSSSEKTVTVTNDGDADLIIGTIAQANPLVAPFSIMNDNCSGQTVTPGEDCSLTVCFSPITTATFNDSFDIPSNDPDEDPVVVNVSGSAYEQDTFNTATVTVSLTGISPGTTLGGLDLTIDYDESKVSFNSSDVGTLTSGATIIPNDDGDTVRVGLIHATGFDGGASGSVMVLNFYIIQPNVPVVGDFLATALSATDLLGRDLALDKSNVSMALDLTTSSNDTPTITTVTASLTGVASGTTIGSLDLTIDYDESKITFNSVAAGSLPSGATVIPNDDGDTVRVGLIHATGFDGGANGSILIFTFTVIQPNIPSSGDFTVTEFLATDLLATDLGLGISNVNSDVVNQ